METFASSSIEDLDLKIFRILPYVGAMHPLLLGLEISVLILPGVTDRLFFQQFSDVPCVPINCEYLSKLLIIHELHAEV